ncbi:MAG: hypothetical protein OXC29_11655 [Rhodococcus sp.]|uniref:hypothetical protein n=1 Tax=Rhodococcus sp. MEB032 TaxID=3040322 RepID=UPI00229DB285|nr:hypothetical protein [Rhodococcus sp. MEB032]MCY4668634.1 hypothetical protein [Rhodococcus sp. (in: high G+C Gram-positive bacteria)]
MTLTPVRIGQALFTLVDPTRGHEVAYNRWYERDHIYSGCMIGPGWFAGRRWVAPMRLKDLRFPASGPVAAEIADGSYLAIYWVHEPETEQAEAWARTQVGELYAAGRGFAEREHVHTGQYLPDSTFSAQEDSVPLELALDHNYRGLVTVMIEPVGGVDRAEAIETINGGPVKLLLDTGAVDLLSNWRMKPWPADHSVPMKMGNDGGTTERILQLCFLEGDPVDSWDHIVDYAANIERSGAGLVTFASPFIPTEVGTDKYTDELW